MVEEATGMAPDMPGHGEFCWSEIATTDVKKARTFYENVFGWSFKSENTGDELEYFEFSSSGEGDVDGGLYEMNTKMFGGVEPPPAHIALYVSVADIDASVAKATELGGTVVFGPYDIPGTGRMAVITDPTGAMISMMTLATP